MKPSLIFIFAAYVAVSCHSTTKIQVPEVEAMSWESEVIQILNVDSVFVNSHSGLVVHGLETGREMINHKGSMYFTPASNTKLLTFYTSLSILGDRLIGLKYYENNDSLIIWGTGDPSFLNSNLVDNDYISDFLKNTDKPIYFSSGNFYDEHFGSGWSWGDYNYGYQCEKNSLPIYGNFVNFRKQEINSKIEVIPHFFDQYLSPSDVSQSSSFIRDESNNNFHYDAGKLDSTFGIDRYLPFKTDPQTIVQLLSEHLEKEVKMIYSNSHLHESIPIRTIEMDSLYRLMLHPSDNFVAEQLLLNCGSELFDSLNTEKVIRWAELNLLSEMPDKFQWVDGSGLSRYNLTTPRNMVYLLNLLHQKVPQEKLFELLPTGGESGTIKNLYKAEKPFIHAKTGSLRNNHSLSGYLIGDSGKVYAFSFMNSNFIESSATIKGGMDKILRILKANL